MSINGDELISVIIPTYNSKDFLPEAVASVLNQTYKNWELIIIDDGSTDGTEGSIKKIVNKADKINYFHKINGGQASARNYGISKSKGELIAFLDADDVWEKNKLEIQISTLKKIDADIIFTGSLAFGNYNGSYIGLPENQRGIQSGETMFKELWYNCGITNSSVLIKKNSLVQLGGLDESQELRGSEDYEYWLRMAKKNMTFFGIDQALVRYRIHPLSTSSNHYRMTLGKLLIYNRYDIDWVKDVYLVERIRKTYRNLLFYTPFPLTTRVLDLYKVYLEKDRGLTSTRLLELISRLFSPRFSAVCAKFVIFKLANKFSL